MQNVCFSKIFLDQLLFTACTLHVYDSRIDDCARNNTAAAAVAAAAVAAVAVAAAVDAIALAVCKRNFVHAGGDRCNNDDDNKQQ